MKSVRLLPIVVFATAALLVLKSIGLITHGSYVLTGTEFAQAQSAPTDSGATAAPASGDQPALSPTDEAAVNRASDALFSDPATPTPNAAQPDAVPYTKTKSGEKVQLRGDDGLSDTERAVLERLSDRRAELDKQAKALDTRQALVDAAEKRLSERIQTLQELEKRITSLVDEKKAMEDKQFAGLVSMYESMKPKDAAAIFNQLSMDVLLRVSTAMNPRKMAPVLAAMATDKAQQLTVLMANQDNSANVQATPADMAALPQIVGQ